MALLAVFAFIAGAATAASPCVLPVLPAILSASMTGGRRRPLGVVVGLAVTFTVTVIGLAEVARSLGLGDDGLRDVAIGVLAVFGVTLAVPGLATWLEARLARIARPGLRVAGHGFWSGLLVGGALGLVYTPCAGPILAAVISVGAASGRTVAIGASYAAGTAVVLLAVALLGRRVLRAARGPGLQRAVGVVMVLTAVAMSFQFDVRFQEAIARHLPGAVIDPTRGLETAAAVGTSLEELRLVGPFARAARPDGGLRGASCSSTSGPTPASTASGRSPT